VVHVDDCTIAVEKLVSVVDFKAGVGKHVEVVDLGELHWLLGIEVKRDREARTIHTSQRAYIDSILRRYGFYELKPVSIPMEASIHLSSTQSPSTTREIALMRDIPYDASVGSLMYTAIATRPDIAYAVQSVSRFLKNPGMPHCIWFSNSCVRF
jgi:hypothetical protein